MKPRMRYHYGLWECCCANCSGLGETPLLAWRNWNKLSLSRYNFEEQA